MLSLNKTSNFNLQTSPKWWTKVLNLRDVDFLRKKFSHLKQWRLAPRRQSEMILHFKIPITTEKILWFAYIHFKSFQMEVHGKFWLNCWFLYIMTKHLRRRSCTLMDWSLRVLLYSKQSKRYSPVHSSHLLKFFFALKHIKPFAVWTV